MDVLEIFAVYLQYSDALLIGGRGDAGGVKVTRKEEGDVMEIII